MCGGVEPAPSEERPIMDADCSDQFKTVMVVVVVVTAIGGHVAVAQGEEYRISFLERGGERERDDPKQ